LEDTGTEFAENCSMPFLKTLHAIFLTITACASHGPVRASDSTAILQAANIVAATAGKRVVALDDRVSSSICPPPWSFSWTAGNHSLLATCDTSEKWRLFLPVAAVPVFQRPAQQSVLTVRSSLPAGTILQDTDLETVLVTPGPNDTRLTRAEQAIGKQLKRRIAAGALLRLMDLTSLPVIKRGDHVVVTTHGEGYQISQTAIALEPGGAGDTIGLRIGSARAARRGIIGPHGEIILAP
jgi:flagella basal body P-ring formation protein FlgA